MRGKYVGTKWTTTGCYTGRGIVVIGHIGYYESKKDDSGKRNDDLYHRIHALFIRHLGLERPILGHW